MKKQIFISHRLHARRLTPIALALAAAGVIGLAQAAPQDGVVRAGSATISGGGAHTRIDQTSQRAIVDWRSFSIGTGERVQFVQPSASAAILNRVTGSQVSMLLGQLDANGKVFLVNPNGIVIGKGGQINVGSFIASTSNISNDNFMAGRLQFDQPGKPGAGIWNQGSITAAEGGLVALVAPHVRNDGLIQARLGKATLGAADTFTIDLYGDQLVNLALSDAHVGQLRDANGQAVSSLLTQAGKIEASQTVLVTAATARNVLDNLINMSGTIKADTAVQDGGRIVLLGEGGKVDVSGTLDASGNRGGQIAVLGQDVNLASSANLNANGTNGGGAIHLGGAWQGSGDTYRAQNTTVEAGANLTANALTSGNGGEVVAWADGNTAFAGNVEAKGGALSGNGGRMEVSGKANLSFTGMADASAPNGTNGSLLLDPAYINITAADAGIINMVIRTGTSATLQADVDINVNSVIDGRGNVAGGGLTMTATNGNINISDFVITNNGAVSLIAGTGVNVAAGKGVFAGSGAIGVTTGGNLTTGPYVTTGALSLTSQAGSVSVNSPIAGNTGATYINAATDVNINQPIVSMAGGGPLNVTAGNDIFVNAQIDGRGGAAGGAVNLTANRNVAINEFVVTNNGAITVKGTTSSATIAAGKGLFAGTAPVSLTAASTISTGTMITTGALNVTSTAGSINIDTPIDATIGPATFTATAAVNVNKGITNTRGDAPLTINAGTNINVNAQIDGRDANPAASGAVNLTAANNVALNQSIITENAAINVTTTNGSYSTVNAATGLFAGTAPISLATGSALTLSSAGAFSTTGLLTLASTNGSVNLDAALTTLLSGASVAVNAGTDINVNAQIEGRGGTAGGSLTMTAGNTVNVNDHITTNNGAVTLTATNGTVLLSDGKRIHTGFGNIALTSFGNLSNGSAIAPFVDPGSAITVDLNDYILLSTTGKLSLKSTNGNVDINRPIGGTTGEITIRAANSLNVNQKVSSNSQPITLTADTGGIVVNPPQSDTALGCVGNVTCINAEGHPTIYAVNGNLNLVAAGNISLVGGAESNATTTITTKGILSGNLNRSNALGNPIISRITNLNAKNGIANLEVNGGDLTATSSDGSISFDGLGISGNVVATALCPSCDVTINSPTINFLRSLTVNAGRSIIIPSGGRWSRASFADLHAIRGDITIGAEIFVLLNSLPPAISNYFNAKAGRDIIVTSASQIQTADTSAPLLGAATFTVGRDFISTGELSLGSLTIQPNLVANPAGNRNVSLRQVNTLGAVNITATTGSITIGTPLGPFYAAPSFSPTNLGIGSLTLTANGPITLEGARAEGSVSITSATNVSSPTYAVTGSTVVISAPSTVGGTPIDASVIASNPKPVPFFGPGGGSPGPTIPPPSAPGLFVTGASGSPSAFPEIVVVGAPGAALARILGLPPTAAGDTGSVDTTSAQRATQSQGKSPDALDDGSPVVVADDGIVVLGGRSNTPQGEKVPCSPGVASGSTIVTKNAAGREQSAVCQ